MMCILLVGGRGNRDDLTQPGIDRLGDTANRPPFSCGVYTLEYQDGGDLLRICTPGKVVQLCLRILSFFL